MLTKSILCRVVLLLACAVLLARDLVVEGTGSGGYNHVYEAFTYTHDKELDPGSLLRRWETAATVSTAAAAGWTPVSLSQNAQDSNRILVRDLTAAHAAAIAAKSKPDSDVIILRDWLTRLGLSVSHFENLGQALAVFNPWLINLFLDYFSHLEAHDPVTLAPSIFASTKYASGGGAASAYHETLLQLFRDTRESWGWLRDPARKSNFVIPMLHGTTCALADRMVRTGVYSDASQPNKFGRGIYLTSDIRSKLLEDKECLLVVLVNTMNSVRPLDPETAQTVKNLPLFSAFSANYVATKCGTMDVCTDLNACDFCDVFVNGHTGTPSPALLPLFLIRAKKATANAAWVHPPIPADQDPRVASHVRQQAVVGQKVSHEYLKKHLGEFAEYLQTLESEIKPLERADVKSGFTSFWNRMKSLKMPAGWRSMPLGRLPVYSKSIDMSAVDKWLPKLGQVSGIPELPRTAWVLQWYAPTMIRMFTSYLALLNQAPNPDFTSESWREKLDRKYRSEVETQLYNKVVAWDHNADFRAPGPFPPPGDDRQATQQALRHRGHTMDGVFVLPAVHAHQGQFASNLAGGGLFSTASLDPGWYGKSIYLSSFYLYTVPYLKNAFSCISIMLTIPGSNPYPVTEEPRSKHSLMGSALPQGYTSFYVATDMSGFPRSPKQAIADEKAGGSKALEVDELSMPYNGGPAPSVLPIVSICPKTLSDMGEHVSRITKQDPVALATSKIPAVFHALTDTDPVSGFAIGDIPEQKRKKFLLRSGTNDAAPVKHYLSVSSREKGNKFALTSDKRSAQIRFFAAGINFKCVSSSAGADKCMRAIVYGSNGGCIEFFVGSDDVIHCVAVEVVFEQATGAFLFRRPTGKETRAKYFSVGAQGAAEWVAAANVAAAPDSARFKSEPEPPFEPYIYKPHSITLEWQGQTITARRSLQLALWNPDNDPQQLDGQSNARNFKFQIKPVDLTSMDVKVFHRQLKKYLVITAPDARPKLGGNGPNAVFTTSWNEMGMIQFTSKAHGVHLAVREVAGPDGPEYVLIAGDDTVRAEMRSFSVVSKFLKRKRAQAVAQGLNPADDMDGEIMRNE